MEGMHKVRAGIMRILGIVIICLFAMMTVIGTYQIVTRYFFNRPSTVSEEHMRMGFLADKITGPARKCLEIAIDLLTFAFAGVVMVYGGISITKLTMIQTTASLRVPMGYIYVIVPVTGLLIMLFSLMNAADMMHRDFSGKEEA